MNEYSKCITITQTAAIMSNTAGAPVHCSREEHGLRLHHMQQNIETRTSLQFTVVCLLPSPKVPELDNYHQQQGQAEHHSIRPQRTSTA
ncbi:hypothetical protein FVEG_17716 [Fusarium verticillioides 7600]|uniref:Uncharacterized protein n=1 Tax=Gibberella moniliformis (strain M3125 / FGSC 7600) TaxID=334819 RepID=W7MXY3_GIBM7|nr:hypothetical protein FVEG_17716 [Fusarium verticillioides 7600]EWG55958.1 hypothetical protein FVEG_17716 [Fusarium verticillioides 7600]